MFDLRQVLSILIIGTVLLSSCAQESTSDNVSITDHTDIKETSKTRSASRHSYGGWYCPDNLRGFPAVDISELDKVPVVNGRMATKEETRNGTSLMFIDPIRHPDAQPLGIEMPRLARFYNEYSKKDELIIVIQAVSVANDSVVGFRYVNGGNGSARLHEVTFLSEEELAVAPATPFVSEEVTITATQAAVFDVITNPMYANELGAAFSQGAYIESEWKEKSVVNVKYGPGITMKVGHITAIWKNMYIQIDYDFDGTHYVEKFFMSPTVDNKEQTVLQVVTGPHGEDMDKQQLIWNAWIEKVTMLSEQK